MTYLDKLILAFNMRPYTFKSERAIEMIDGLKRHTATVHDKKYTVKFFFDSNEIWRVLTITPAEGVTCQAGNE